MEVVWQNAPLFSKSHFFANLFFAQAFYLRHLKSFVSKVAKVTGVTPKSPKSPDIVEYYKYIILKIVY